MAKRKDWEKEFEAKIESHLGYLGDFLGNALEGNLGGRNTKVTPSLYDRRLEDLAIAARESAQIEADASRQQTLSGNTMLTTGGIAVVAGLVAALAEIPGLGQLLGDTLPAIAIAVGVTAGFVGGLAAYRQLRANPIRKLREKLDGLQERLMQSLAKSDKSKQKLAKSGEKAKRKSEKVIGGVAAWVSNKTGINVVLLRLVLIGTLFASAGAAIIGYILVSLALTGTEKEEQPEF